MRTTLREIHGFRVTEAFPRLARDSLPPAIIEASYSLDERQLAAVYFLGSIVLIKKPGVPEAKVVDGQQRLTTLTFLLSVMRDLTTADKARFQRSAYVQQEADADKGTSDRCRLLLWDRDRPFFQKYVQTPGGTRGIQDHRTLKGSQQLIAGNAEYFRTEMEAMDELRRDKLFAFIIQRCYLVVVAVPTPESARPIFTVLNARGMDLMPTDILKADLLDCAGAVPENALAKRWEAVESSLGRDKFVELFGHIRMIFEREKPRSALETGFAIFVPPFNGDAESFVSDILEPIVDVSELLARSSDVQTQFGPEAAKAVRFLGRIDHKDWLPPVLLRLWKRSPNDNVAIANFLIDLERLAYFLFVTRADVNERISRFTAVMDEVDPRPSKMPPNVGLALKPEEQATFRDALAGPLYNKSRVCKPVLQRLDEALANVSAGYDDPTSIEHVLPQTVGPDSEWALLFPDEVRAAWTHRLGNLVFLTTDQYARV